PVASPDEDPFSWVAVGEVIVSGTPAAGRAPPVTMAWELDTNPDPPSATVNGAPAVTEDGDSVTRTGAGLLIVKGHGADVLPVGSLTVTLTIRPTVSNPPGIVACNWVPLIKVAGNGVPLKLITSPAAN